MKIEKNLPQFENEKALILIAGEQAVIFYFVSEGEINELEQFKMHDPKYSDREGFMQKSLGREELISGSVYESPKKYIHVKFLKRLQSEIKDIWKEYFFNSIYVFAPDFMMNEVSEVFKPEFQKMMKFKSPGNYWHVHPFKLLRKIQKEYLEKSRLFPLKEEAKKLLDKSKNK